MAITVTTATPGLLDANGGARLDIRGDFGDHLGQFFRVELVPSGGGDPLPSLSGVPGRAYLIFPLNDTRMVAYAPQAEPGVIYDLEVTLVDDVLINGGIASVFEVLPKLYNSAVFNYRSSLPPTYITGPRNLSQLERIP